MDFCDQCSPKGPGFSVDPALGELLRDGGGKHSVCFPSHRLLRDGGHCFPLCPGGFYPSISPVVFWENRPL